MACYMDFNSNKITLIVNPQLNLDDRSYDFNEKLLQSWEEITD